MQLRLASVIFFLFISKQCLLGHNTVRFVTKRTARSPICKLLHRENQIYYDEADHVQFFLNNLSIWVSMIFMLTCICVSSSKCDHFVRRESHKILAVIEAKNLKDLLINSSPLK